MGSTNLLKHRFEKLQKAADFVADEIELNSVVPSDQKVLELQASAYPEVHEKVRQATVLQHDWKKQYKQLFHRPTLESGRSKAMLEFEWNLQLLTKNPPIISFSQDPQLDQVLAKASVHMEGSKNFWKTILRNAHNLHLSNEKNKIHLSVNYYSNTKDLRVELKKNLEKEYLSESNTIKTFQLTGHDTWVDIILELTPVTNGRRAEDATT